MKAKNFITAMTIMMVMGTGTMFANNNGHGHINRNGFNDRHHKTEHVMHNNPHHHAPAHNVHHNNHFDHRKYDIRGYEDRVRYNNGYWSYYRDGRWYHYNHFIAPRTYYSTPLSKIGTGIVIGAIVGSVISALAH